MYDEAFFGARLNGRGTRILNVRKLALIPFCSNVVAFRERDDD